ncbi:MAG: sigma 54-interacting transcriptional regulator [Gallionellaceae bacterium]|jgi:two-component system response regulator GlrR|nr:sigma 54-interacting transcriptional regulator [Gallionellaceae bacterium]
MTTTMTKTGSGARILLVDDDADLLRLLSMRLIAAGYTVATADSAERALAMLEMERPRLVITDMRMGGMDGMALFERIHEMMPTLPVIMLTAHGSIPDAVSATQRGLFGYLTKPFDSRLLQEQVEKALRLPAGLQSGGAQTGADGKNDWRADIITRNAEMEELLARAAMVASGDASVLVRGESGTGKELLARAIHKASRRASRPFVAINCAAIPESLLESELFGYVKGAFTGAARDRKGLFLSADGGTVFLDEIGDMPLTLQSKLLRVLQERQVTPLGSVQPLPLDVRIISATHRNLQTEIAEGRFREDIYYRLNVIELEMPPLSRRREDISLLAQHFLGMFAERYDKKISGFAPEAMEALVVAPWPGNVRQLLNVVEQCVILSAASIVSPVLVQQAIQEDAEALVSLEEAKKRFERDYLIRILKIANGNVSQAARLSQRNRTEFYKLLQKHHLTPASMRRPPDAPA